MKQWKCTVCGYIHIGDEPPDTCPRCGADRSRFVEITTQETSESLRPEAAKPSQQQRSFQPIAAFLWKIHLHPISVHIPNGVLPLSVLFLFIAGFFGLDNFAVAARYNLLCVVLAMPVVLASGFIDWINRFHGKWTSLFITKMICGLIVLATSTASLVWQVLDPEIVGVSSGRGVFFLLQLIMLGAAVVAGYCGGKLVFAKD